MARSPPTKEHLHNVKPQDSRGIHLHALAQGTLTRFWLVSEERRHRMQRLESETRGIRFKPVNQEDSWFALPLDRNRCAAATVNGRQRARESGEGCIPTDSTKQNYCLGNLRQMVPLSSNNHFEEEMRALMNGLVLYRKETRNSEVKAETAPFIHTLDSTACK